jgi:hypothetical protein
LRGLGAKGAKEKKRKEGKGAREGRNKVRRPEEKDIIMVTFRLTSTTWKNKTHCLTEEHQLSNYPGTNEHNRTTFPACRSSTNRDPMNTADPRRFDRDYK